MKQKRWRAKNGERYYCISLVRGLHVESDNELQTRYDDEDYKSGNYFKTRRQAQTALTKIKKILNG